MYKLLYILIALSLLAGSALGDSYTWIAHPGAANSNRIQR